MKGTSLDDHDDAFRKLDAHAGARLGGSAAPTPAQRLSGAAQHACRRPPAVGAASTSHGDVTPVDAAAANRQHSQHDAERYKQ